MRPEYLRLLGHLRMKEVDRSAAKAWPSRSVPAGGNNVLGDGMMEGWKGFGSVPLPVPGVGESGCLPDWGRRVNEAAHRT